MRIIPTPVMRFNFLKHILRPNATVIELGTGASAIIAMLAAKQFNARVYATEMDPQYIEYANENVRRNSLTIKLPLLIRKDSIWMVCLMQNSRGLHYFQPPVL